MAGLGKKPAMMAGARFAGMFDKLSKAALIDTLFCACQLGTNDTVEEYMTQAARNAVAAAAERGDRLPRVIVEQAKLHIDSD